MKPSADSAPPSATRTPAAPTFAAASAMFGLPPTDRGRSSTGHSTMMMDTDDLEMCTVARASTAARMPLQGGLVDASVATGVAASAHDRLSDKEAHTSSLVRCGHVRVIVDALVVAGIAIALCLAAYHSDNAALPFIFLALGALATFEYTWLTYRLRIRLYLPFKLHQKHTCRDIYGQIMSYTVDLNTCAITPWAERAFRGHRNVAAGLVASVSAALAALVAWISTSHAVIIAYATTAVFLGVWCIALAPNLRDASILALRFAYFALCTADLLSLTGRASDIAAKEPLIASFLDPLTLLLFSVALVMIVRAMSSKDPMQSVVMVLLDVAGLLYLAGFANVVSFLVALLKREDLPRFSAIGIFCIIWSAELGGYLMQHALRGVGYRWSHPVSSRLSTQHNVEKLVGALAFAAASSALVGEVVFSDASPLTTNVLLPTSLVAVVIAHVGKLWLLSLKHVAKVDASGRYLRVGDGVIDRLDSLLLSVVVYVIVLHRRLAMTPPAV
ncbi:hypothetical protein P43SY_002407 [Pythium insidiosum]|uniref:Phosphatidate cytidylyltransferase n=1 Tax=Pythium insidiosum TaxID=114742 RepID=A0AAD5M803_PYTIN|nr:hypothetical protein P43SY_002407 [Pythium insidiosum]